MGVTVWLHTRSTKRDNEGVVGGKPRDDRISSIQIRQKREMEKKKQRKKATKVYRGGEKFLFRVFESRKNRLVIVSGGSIRRHTRRNGREKRNVQRRTLGTRLLITSRREPINKPKKKNNTCDLGSTVDTRGIH
jgi:hypothetical protein